MLTIEERVFALHACKCLPVANQVFLKFNSLKQVVFSDGYEETTEPKGMLQNITWIWRTIKKGLSKSRPPERSRHERKMQSFATSAYCILIPLQNTKNWLFIELETLICFPFKKIGLEHSRIYLHYIWK
jgi:hypothetical protein